MSKDATGSATASHHNGRRVDADRVTEIVEAGLSVAPAVIQQHGIWTSNRFTTNATLDPAALNPGHTNLKIIWVSESK